MIHLAPLPHRDAAQVAHLHLPADQQSFVGHIRAMTDEQTPLIDFHAIWEDTTAVGFFKIDRGYAQSYDFAHANEPGLRGLLIGGQFQGRGLGRAFTAALPGYLRHQYPNTPSVVLTVNCKNKRAHHTYVSGGWTDTGTLYHGGPSGPQHILRLLLII